MDRSKVQSAYNVGLVSTIAHGMSYPIILTFNSFSLGGETTTRINKKFYVTTLQCHLVKHFLKNLIKKLDKYPGMCGRFRYYIAKAALVISIAILF